MSSWTDSINCPLDLPPVHTSYGLDSPASLDPNILSTISLLRHFFAVSTKGFNDQQSYLNLAIIGALLQVDRVVPGPFLTNRRHPGFGAFRPSSRGNTFDNGLIKQSKNCNSLDRDESCTRHFDGWPARFEKQGRESIFPSPQQHTAAKCNLPSDRPTSNLGRPVDSILARTATF
jgi:hypothetical protein